jgi:hypothetical protein
MYCHRSSLAWTSVQPHSNLWSSVISTLRGQKLPLRQWTTQLDQRHGGTGPDIPKNVTSTLGCGSTPSPPSKPTSLPLPQGFDLASSGMQSKLDTKLWKKPSVMWRKPCFWPDTTILDGRTDPKSLPFRHLLKAYKNKDPAPQPQLAIPVATIEQAATYYAAARSLDDSIIKRQTQTSSEPLPISLLLLSSFYLEWESIQCRDMLCTNSNRAVSSSRHHFLTSQGSPSTQCEPVRYVATGRLCHTLDGQPEEWAVWCHNPPHCLPRLVLSR